MISPFSLFLLLVTQACTGKHFLVEVEDNSTLKTVTNKSKNISICRHFVTEFIQELLKQIRKSFPPASGLHQGQVCFTVLRMRVLFVWFCRVLHDTTVMILVEKRAS